MKDPKEMSWAKRNFAPYSASDFAEVDWRPKPATWIGWIAMLLVVAAILIPMWTDMLGNEMGWWCDAPSLYRDPTPACSAPPAPKRFDDGTEGK